MKKSSSSNKKAGSPATKKKTISKKGADQNLPPIDKRQSGISRHLLARTQRAEARADNIPYHSTPKTSIGE